MLVAISIPALVALIFKLILIGYSVRASIHDTVARLLLALLVVLSLLNFDEFFVLNYLPKHGLAAWVQAAGFAYIGLWGLAIPILLHLSLALSVDGISKRRWLVIALYIPIAPIEYLLLFTDKMVLYFKPFQYSILREPGPWYWIIECWAIAYLSATLIILLYGARSSRPALPRMRNRLWLAGLAPVVGLAIYLIVANRFGWTKLTFPVYAPIAITIFLLITTYATHERPRPGGFYRFLYRLFDIESYLPWSKIYKRKSNLYGRVREMIASIGQADSINGVIRRLSDILQCPVVLMHGRRPLAALAGGSPAITQIPHDALQGIDQIVVAREIAQSMPRTHALMARHNIAAIVPFHAHSHVATWLLLGEAFNEHVYTPIDFDVVKKLFDRLADYLLDEQVRMRSRLAEVRQQTLIISQQLADTTQALASMEKALAAKPENRRVTSQGQPLATATVGAEMTGQATNGRKTLEDYIADLERRMIAEELARCGGNQAQAAKQLGLRPNTLHYKIQRYGLKDRKKSE